jgi:hypothetical protein
MYSGSIPIATYVVFVRFYSAFWVEYSLELYNCGPKWIFGVFAYLGRDCSACCGRLILMYCDEYGCKALLCK